MSHRPTSIKPSRTVAALFHALVLLSPSLAVAAAPTSEGPSLSVPAFTAYLEPDNGSARVSSRAEAITRWTDPRVRVLWFGNFTNAGALRVEVELRLPETQSSRLRLTLGSESRETVVQGLGVTNRVVASFGLYTLHQPGYGRFALESLNPAGAPAGDITALRLAGPAAAGAQFNLKARRNAASVHLGYPVPAGTNVAAFYCEVTGVDDPVATYYMACGWHRGYFGMQVNSPTERRIIFSVWDSGKEAVDRTKVADENRVTLLRKGDGVHANDFGNEGTGGHSHLNYVWRTGEVQRFLVTAQPTNHTFTVYTGYYLHPEKRAWMVISSWRAPKDGSWMRGLYSFSENFDGANGHLRRKALFGRQWFRDSSGSWHELTTARFTHDPTGKSDRLDRFAGVEGGRFFLSQGGFVEGFTRSGDRFSRPSTERPSELDLPLP